MQATEGQSSESRARVRQQYDNSGGDEADRLTVEEVRSAINTWLAAADLKPDQRKERYEEDLKQQLYHQRRNQQARNSHTKTRIIRLHALGIDVDRIKSCITRRRDDDTRCCPSKAYNDA